MRLRLPVCRAASVMEVGVDRFEATVPTSEDCVWIAGYSEVASTSGLPTHPPGTPQGSLFRAQCVTRLFSVSEVPLVGLS